MAVATTLLETVHKGFDYAYGLSADIALRSYVKGFYNSVNPSNGLERKILSTNGQLHINDVEGNVKTICGIMGKKPSEELTAAALCHDLGYLAHLIDSSIPASYGEDHHVKSAIVCEGYLGAAGYSKDKISKIKGIIEAHDDDMPHFTDDQIACL